MRRFIPGLVLLGLAACVGSEESGSKAARGVAPARGSSDKAVPARRMLAERREEKLAEHRDQQQVTVRIAVFDDTEREPLPEKAEIWIRGLGSWWISKENVAEVPGRDVGATDTMFIYPDARSGTELSVRFQMTAEMCPQGCVRDMIQVDISDAEVVVHGAPIRAANDSFEVTLKRR